MGKYSELLKKEDSEWTGVLKEAFTNMPSSAARFVGDIGHAVLNPKQTAEAIADIGVGAVQKVVSSDSEYMKEKEKHFDAIKSFFIDRYGSVNSFKKSVATDPVGVLGDVASLVSGVGAATRSTAAAGKIAKLGTAGKIIQDIGMAAEPINIVKRGAQVMAKLTPSAVPERLYQGAAKFSTIAGKYKKGVTSQEIRKKLVGTALDNQIMPTYKGVEKLGDKIRNLDTQIGQLVEVPTAQGVTVSAKRLKKGFDDYKRHVMDISPTPAEDLRAINTIERQFKEFNSIAGPGRQRIWFGLTPTEIQSKKVEIYQRLKSHYEKTMTKPVKVETQKLIARNAMKEMEKIVPEIKTLNNSYGPLAELREALDQSASRISNRNILETFRLQQMQAGAAIGGAIGYKIGDAPGAASGAITGGSIALVYGIITEPRVSAKIALVIDQLKKRGINLKPTRRAIELGLFQAGREAQIEISD